MAGLDKILQLFAREDVSEIVLQSGRVVAIRRDDKLEAASRAPLSAGQIAGLLQGEPALSQIPAPGSPPVLATIQRGGLRMRVQVQCSQQQLQVRIVRDQPVGRSAPTAARTQPQVEARPPSRASSTQPPTQPRNPAREQPPSPAPERTQAKKAVAQPRSSPRQATPGKLESYLAQARAESASDLHLSSGRPAMFRTAGELVPQGETICDEQLRPMLDAIMTEREAQQLTELGYSDFAYDSPDAGRFRVNVCAHKNGIKGCFRVIAREPMSLEQLALPEQLAKVVDHHQGLAIISGPNGQGKTTTLAAIVDLLNTTKAVHIISVEDPIEIVHPVKEAVISQRQVGRDTKTFGSALKGALRQDPDVIVIGELRDRETVEMALSAAETGHLVIATMNTPSGAKTIGRLIDLFPPDDQAQVRATLAGTLMIVVSQRLLPRADGSGRVAAAEVISGGVPLWTLIRENKLVQLPGLMQRGKSMGMISLDNALEVLTLEGTITREVAARYAQDKGAFDDAAANDDPDAQAQQQGAGRFSGLRKMMGGNKG